VFEVKLFSFFCVFYLGSKVSEFEVSRFHQYSKRNGWGWDRFVGCSRLLDPANGVFVEDTLAIRCKITIYGDFNYQVSCTKDSLPSFEEMNTRSQSKVTTDLGLMFDQGVWTDVEIVARKTKFMAHKCLLSGTNILCKHLLTQANVSNLNILIPVFLLVRSQVFAAMLNSQMVQAHSNKVEIADFDPDTVKGMLQYLYTGKTDLLTERATDLLEIAEKYDIPGLKWICQHSLATNLDKENAAVMLVLADRNNALYLKARVTDFINT